LLGINQAAVGLRRPGRWIEVGHGNDRRREGRRGAQHVVHPHCAHLVSAQGDAGGVRRLSLDQPHRIARERAVHRRRLEGEVRSAILVGIRHVGTVDGAGGLGDRDHLHMIEGGKVGRNHVGGDDPGIGVPAETIKVAHEGRSGTGRRLQDVDLVYGPAMQRVGIVRDGQLDEGVGVRVQRVPKGGDHKATGLFVVGDHRIDDGPGTSLRIEGKEVAQRLLEELRSGALVVDADELIHGLDDVGGARRQIGIECVRRHGPLPPQARKTAEHIHAR
jgi:hypothetical protein